ncbi:MAG: TonB-dependent receptor [Myxococcota bacterium]
MIVFVDGSARVGGPPSRWVRPFGRRSCRQPGRLAFAISTSIFAASTLAAAADSERAGGSAEPRVQGDPWAGVEEMIVTGSNVSDLLLGSPTSITSFDALELEAQGVKDVGDLAAATPNLAIARSSATQATFFIRGVGLQDFSPNSTSAVAVSQDGVGMNTSPLQLGQIFDSSSVDVLRGPRGTGGYRNGSAGAIVISSRKPEFDYQASLRAQLGTWAPSVHGAHQGLIQDYEGVFNMPLVEDVIAARLAFRVHKAEPFKVNGCGFALPFSERVPRIGPNSDPGPASQCGEKEVITFPSQNLALGVDGLSPIPEGLSQRFGEENNWAARGILLIQPPGTDYEFLLNFHGARINQQPVVGQAMGTGRYPNGTPPAFLGGIVNGQGTFATNYTEPDQRRQFLALCRPQPPSNSCANPQAGAQLAKSLARHLDDRPYRGDVNREGVTRLESFGVNLNAIIPLVESGFSTLDLETLTAFDRYKRFEERDLDYTPETIFEGSDADRSEQVWQEISLSGRIDSMLLDWEVGGFYFWEKLGANLFLFLPVSPFATFDANFFGIRRLYDQRTNSTGIWTKLSWEFADNFTLDGGIRYNWERKTFAFDRVQGGVRQGLDQDEVWSVPTGEVSLTYDVTEDISFAVRYSRGFKPGTFNSGVNAQQQTDTVDPEFLDAFEGILSAAVLNGKISLRSEFFYYLYENYQVFLFSDQPTGPPVLEVQNADSVENYGADVQLILKPLDDLVDERFEDMKIEMRFGWLESQFIDFTNQRIFRNPAGITIPVTVDFSGNRLPNSPRFSVSGSIDWTLDLGRFGEIMPRYDFTFVDDFFFDAEEGRGNVNASGQHNLPDFTTGQHGYVLHNVRLTYRPPDSGIEIAGWVRNIRDERFKLFAFDASQFSNLVINTLGQPRTVGVDVKYTF